jgi:hypothetical protein
VTVKDLSADSGKILHAVPQPSGAARDLDRAELAG